MTWLEMVAHYKGYRNLLQDNGSSFTPIVWDFPKRERRPNGRGQRSPERPFPAVLPVRETTGARS